VSIEFTVSQGVAAGLTVGLDILQIGDEAVPSLGEAVEMSDGV